MKASSFLVERNDLTPPVGQRHCGDLPGPQTFEVMNCRKATSAHLIADGSAENRAVELESVDFTGVAVAAAVGLIGIRCDVQILSPSLRDTNRPRRSPPT